MNAAPKYWAVIPAAGVGERVGASRPKQYLQIAGKTLLEHAASCFVNNDQIAGLIFSIKPGDEIFSSLDFDNSGIPIYTVDGGNTRAESVLNALNYLETHASHDDFVLVHDAARPCLADSDLTKLLIRCSNDEVGGILAIPVTDTIKRVSQDRIVDTQSRDNSWRALTPQMFRYGLLKDAVISSLSKGIAVTDEASAVEYAGYKPCVVEGSDQNLKVTTSNDFKIAEMFLHLKEKADY